MNIPSSPFSDAEMERAFQAEPAPIEEIPAPEGATEAFLAESAAGRPELAASAFLARSAPGRLEANVFALAETASRRRRSKLPARELASRRFLWESLLALSADLAGAEAPVLGFSPGEASGALAAILDLLGHRETEEAGLLPGIPIGRRIVDAALEALRTTGGLPALLASEMETECRGVGPRAFAEIHANRTQAAFHRRLSDAQIVRFSSEGVRGLSTLRRLGFAQASMDARLASIAFDESPSLLLRFQREAADRLEWREDPGAHSHAMAMTGALLALWRGLTDFRLPSIRTGRRDFAISFRLNPNLSDHVGESLQDAARVYGIATEFLDRFDRRLLPPAETVHRAGPNIAFGFAASSGAAREITLRLATQGIGLEQISVHSVAQGVSLILDAFDGKAEAARGGMPIAQASQTHACAALPAHLRSAAARSGLPLSGRMERAALSSGLLVLQRVHRIFFAPEHRSAWLRWLEERHGVTTADASRILDSTACVASMGPPEETLRALAHPNLVLAETPSEAQGLERAARTADPLSETAGGGLLHLPLGEEHRMLSALPDYVRAIELAPDLARVLADEVGLPGVAAWGTRGPESADWASFGPVAASLAEARSAFDAFRARLQDIATGNAVR